MNPATKELTDYLNESKGLISNSVYALRRNKANDIFIGTEGNGINILNVWDMTYYQFMKMFLEYRMGRQADINDMMAANSFSFKNSKDYNPMEYMNKIK